MVDVLAFLRQRYIRQQKPWQSRFTRRCFVVRTAIWRGQDELQNKICGIK